MNIIDQAYADGSSAVFEKFALNRLMKYLGAQGNTAAQQLNMGVVKNPTGHPSDVRAPQPGQPSPLHAQKQQLMAQYSGQARMSVPTPQAPASAPPQQQQPGFMRQVAMQALPIAAMTGVPYLMDKVMGGSKQAPPDEPI